MRTELECQLSSRGGLAQMVERSLSMGEVPGSIPGSSRKLFFCLFFQECLQAKDHLNYRYFHKRALYLSIVAGHLKKKKRHLGLKDVSFSLAVGNPLLPIILVEFEGVCVCVCVCVCSLSALFFDSSQLFKHHVGGKIHLITQVCVTKQVVSIMCEY